MKTDIRNRKDIEKLVNAFYDNLNSGSVLRGVLRLNLFFVRVKMCPSLQRPLHKN